MIGQLNSVFWGTKTTDKTEKVIYSAVFGSTQSPVALKLGTLITENYQSFKQWKWTLEKVLCGVQAPVHWTRRHQKANCVDSTISDGINTKQLVWYGKRATNA